MSFRAGLRAEPSKPKVAACFAALVCSVGVVIFGLAMIANSGDSRFLL